MSEQIDYKEKIVPIEKWAKDHWSTLAYVETRCVDHKGFLDNRQMRCDARLHQRFATQFTGSGQYPTRLKNNEEAINHDDFSCLEDAAHYGLLTEIGLVENESRRNFKLHLDSRRKVQFYGQRNLVIKLLPPGLKLCAELRSFKSRGGQFAMFQPSSELLEEINQYAKNQTAPV